MSKRIKYIGNQPWKRDNVCRTSLTWKHPGAIVECPDEVAVRLLNHPDVWVEAAPGDKGLPMQDMCHHVGPMTREERIEAAIKTIDEQDGWAFVDHFIKTGELPSEAMQPQDDSERDKEPEQIGRAHV